MSLSLQALNITSFRIIAVSLDVRIANGFVFHAIRECLHPDFNTHAFGHCDNFSGKKVARTLILNNNLHSQK